MLSVQRPQIFCVESATVDTELAEQFDLPFSVPFVISVAKPLAVYRKFITASHCSSRLQLWKWTVTSPSELTAMGRAPHK